MSRNQNNLTPRQQLFLNELVRGKQFNDILSEHRIRSATLMRWSTEPDFEAQWNLCNQVLVLRRQSDESCAIRQAQPEHSTVSRAAPTPPTVFLLPPPQPSPLPAPEKNPPMSEREAVRTRHGEEAAQAFDRLRRLREQPLHAAAADPTSNPTVSPPENIPIAPTPPPPVHSPVTAQEVQP